MCSRTRPGFTLIEVMVGSTLALLLLGLFVAFLVPAMRYSGDAAARSEVQQQAIIALNSMEADLRQCSSATVTLVKADSDPTHPVGFCCVPIADVSADARQLWQTTVLEHFWDRSSQRMMRKTWPPAPPGSLGVTLQIYSPSALSPADFVTLAQTPNGTERTLAVGVANFTLSGAGPGPAVVPPVSLQLTLERFTKPNQPPIRCELQRSVATRNEL